MTDVRCRECGQLKAPEEMLPDYRRRRPLSRCRECYNARRRKPAHLPRVTERIPAPAEWLLRKRCSRCGEEKPWALFSPKRWWPDGSVRSVYSSCRKCNAAMARERWKRRRRPRSKEEKMRDAQWKRRRRAQMRVERADRDWLPAEPFRRWLRSLIEDEGEGIGEIADRAGLQSRTLYRVLHENEGRVALRVVDCCLVAHGWHLHQLYPLDETEAA